METTLKIDESTARRIYPTAAPEMKTILENSFPKDFFSMKITDRVKGLLDALEICPVSENVRTLLSYNGTDEFMIGAQTFLRLSIIATALRGEWKPDWSNHNQKKWYPYFEHTKSGVGFSGTDYDYWNSITSVGSRLCFPTAELAEYFGKEFISDHRILLSNN